MCLAEFLVVPTFGQNRGQPFSRCLSYNRPRHFAPLLSRSGHSTLRSIGLAVPPDTRRVWVRMFGYAKCSSASQVECLMGLLCLNTGLDTTGRRAGVFGSTCVWVRRLPEPELSLEVTSNVRRNWI